VTRRTTRSTRFSVTEASSPVTAWATT
jgi:hypothetical protein